MHLEKIEINSNLQWRKYLWRSSLMTESCSVSPVFSPLSSPIHYSPSHRVIFSLTSRTSIMQTFSTTFHPKTLFIHIHLRNTERAFSFGRANPIWWDAAHLLYDLVEPCKELTCIFLLSLFCGVNETLLTRMRSDTNQLAGVYMIRASATPDRSSKAELEQSPHSWM
jgi:hypothetical protein